MESVASEDVLLHQRNLEEGQDDLSSSQALKLSSFLIWKTKGRLLLSQSLLQPWNKGSRSPPTFLRQLSQ